MAEYEDPIDKSNGVYAEVIENGSHKEEKGVTLYGVLRRLVAEIFFPDPNSSCGSDPFVRRVKGSLSENFPHLRDASRNSGRDVLHWTRRGSPLRALLVVSVSFMHLSIGYTSSCTSIRVCISICTYTRRPAQRDRDACTNMLEITRVKS